MKNYALIKGDVTKPKTIGNKIIIHCCNNLFVMGAGVALALRKMWPVVYSEYKRWEKQNPRPKLGDVQFINVSDNTVVGNMLGQDGIDFDNGIPPIRYDAMDKALKKVATVAKKHDASVHIPYLMGCGLAGGDWDIVEKMIVNNLCENDIEVIIYDFN